MYLLKRQLLCLGASRAAWSQAAGSWTVSALLWWRRQLWWWRGRGGCWLWLDDDFVDRIHAHLHITCTPQCSHYSSNWQTVPRVEEEGAPLQASWEPPGREDVLMLMMIMMQTMMRMRVILMLVVMMVRVGMAMAKTNPLAVQLVQDNHPPSASGRQLSPWPVQSSLSRAKILEAARKWCAQNCFWFSRYCWQLLRMCNWVLGIQLGVAP